jgi:hypothetical protein
MKGWGRYVLVSSPADADFGLRDQLGPPPRPQGGESKGYTVLIGRVDRPELPSLVHL